MGVWRRKRWRKKRLIADPAGYLLLFGLLEGWKTGFLEEKQNEIGRMILRQNNWFFVNFHESCASAIFDRIYKMQLNGIRFTNPRN